MNTKVLSLLVCSVLAMGGMAPPPPPVAPPTTTVFAPLSPPPTINSTSGPTVVVPLDQNPMQPPAQAPVTPPPSPAGLNDFEIGVESTKMQEGKPNKIRQWIKEKKLDPKWNNGKLLESAVIGGDHTMLSSLLNRKVPVPPSTLGSAVNSNRAQMVRLLLQTPGVDPRADDDSAIALSVIMCKPTILRMLLADKRIDPKTHGGMLLPMAMTQNCPRAAKMLLDDGRISPHQVVDGKPMMEYAKASGNQQIVRDLETAQRRIPKAN